LTSSDSPGAAGTSSPGADQSRSFRSEALVHLDAVYRFALRLSGDPDAAGDLTQETFLRAWRSWESYAVGTRAKSWLFTICRNTFLRGEGREKRHTEILKELVDEDPRRVSGESTVFSSIGARDPEGTFWERLVDDRILREIDALPPEFRDAVVLSDLEDLSYQEVAEILEVPVGTVKSRIFRGRRILQERLYDVAVASGIIESSSESVSGQKDDGA
jgi:RNA polymerase sigma-70 factor (ECF subfamily)